MLVHNIIRWYKNVTHCMHAYQWQQHGWSWCGGVSCPELELYSLGSGGAGPSLEPPLDLGAVYLWQK